ncbi:MAG: hypothetical protein KAY32_11805 [Candidatus Eisenbacteria sp.]|nr:hypothetical protein [Candidatus Eisenbacteria bacterium]
MRNHLTLVGAFHLGFGLLGIVIAVFIYSIVAGAGILSGEPEAIAITSFVGSAVAMLIAVTSIPAVIGGIGLLKRRPWARILVLIVSVLELFNIPIGTALGAYSIWVLLQDETEQLLRNPQDRDAAAIVPSPAAPPM